ncbi:MAG TPA: hypothetical protein VKY81_09575 [Natronosporangium sp.]|nr:hypothetical protein [Natronosporangium sp.]
MPSSLHEALVHMFRHRPELAAELLTEAFGLSLPEYGGAALGSGDLSPVEFRADAVVVLSADNRPVLAVVVEAQLRRDTRKRWSWPVYLTTLRARLRCPAVLLVVCPDARTAAWCASPIVLGPGATMTPLVLGPREVPVVTDPARAGRCPELAVLSAMAHGLHPEREKIFVAMLEALRSVDAAHATRYHDLVFAALPAVARHHLEKLMTTTYEYQSDFVRKYVHQGRAEGRVEGRVEGEVAALFAVLSARGIDVPDDARARISACTDPDQLEAWIRRAATAESVADLFE